MSLNSKNIEIKNKGFLIQYGTKTIEFYPFSQVKSVRLLIRDYDASFEVQVYLSKDGVRTIRFDTEGETRQFFYDFLNSLNQSL